MPNPAIIKAPRLGRAVLVQALALALGLVVADRPWAHREEPRKEEPQKPAPPKKPEPLPRPEKQIRVVKIEAPPKEEQKREPKPEPEPPKVAQATPPEPPPPEPAPPKPPPQQKAAQPPPRAPAAQAQRSEPAQRPALAPPRHEPARQHIAADATAVHGVPLRVLVPRSPAELAAHLRNSGACLVVSRLSGEGAEVLSLLGLDGGGRHASLEQGAPCSGVPRLLRDASLNDALGDPLGRVRAGLAPSEQGSELALQVLLSPSLPARAQEAMRARFGPVSQEEMAQRAAAAGYEVTCFAEPAGAVRCE